MFCGKKKTLRRKELKNKHWTVHVVETEQTPLPTCAEATLSEPLAPTEETLCEETRYEETLLEQIAPTDETLLEPLAPKDETLQTK